MINWNLFCGLEEEGKEIYIWRKEYIFCDEREEQRRKRRKIFGEGKCYHGGTNNNNNKQGNIEYSANGLGKAEMSNFIRT